MATTTRLQEDIATAAQTVQQAVAALSYVAIYADAEKIAATGENGLTPAQAWQDRQKWIGVTLRALEDAVAQVQSIEKTH